ncbi:hypothetical protein [Pedobacter ureilyticus]|uniref:DUF4840 domain-containing protein n=1 Tax=Pedobacter ureilyticus TaxID=1393051 RepID=A0ABW9J4D1_9SPHI|nr:hypothetical protein [Pedobacter helvus]
MKRIFLFFVAAAAVSCTNNETKEATTTSNIFIEQKVSEFVAQHPEWTSGDNTNEEITDKFQHEVKRWSNEEDFLKDMPLQLKSIRDTTVSGQEVKLGTFSGYNDNTRPSGSILNYIQVNVDGIMPADIAQQVKVNGKYTLEAMMYRQGSRKDVKLINVADFRGYDLGKYVFSVVKVNPIK